MQDLVALGLELPALQEMCPDLHVVDSGDRYNPIAAAVLVGQDDWGALAGVRLRIPIPNLYGFARSASVVLLDKSLGAPNGSPARGVRPIEARHLGAHRECFVDLRVNDIADEYRYYLLLTPPQAFETFEHVSLVEFVRGLVSFANDPVAWLEREFVAYSRLWNATGNAWWLLRAARAAQDLGRDDEGATILAFGRDTFPGRPEFNALLRERD